MTITEFLLARIDEDEEAVIMAYDLPFTQRQMLAECEAKRRIVELRYSWNLQAERNPEPPFGPILQAQVITADTVIRTLAAVYADHADFDPSWSIAAI